MASDDTKAEKGSVAEIEKELNEVKQREMKLSDELMKLIKRVDKDLVSFAESIDQFHQEVEKAIPSINSDNEMGVQELVAKTPENISQLVKSVKDVKSKMQTDMIKSLSKLLHFIHVDSEEICTNKLPGKFELHIDSFCPHDKSTSEVVDVWIEMLQDDNKRLRERNKLYREHAALVNKREKLVSEERDRLRKELNVLYQKRELDVGANHKETSTNDLSFNDSGKEGVHDTEHKATSTDDLSFDGSGKEGMHSTEHKEPKTDDLSFDGSGKEGVHDTEHKEPKTDDLSFDGSGKEGMHSTEHKEPKTNDLFFDGSGKEGVHDTEHKEPKTDDLSFDGSGKEGVHDTEHKATSTDDLSFNGSGREGVHGTDDKETSTEDLVYDTDVVKNGAQGTYHKAETTDDSSSVDNDKQGIHGKHYKETNIDDVEKDRIIQEMQKSLNDAQQQNDQSTASLRQSLKEKEELLRTVSVQSRYEVDVVYARIAKYVQHEECLVGLLTQKYIDCNIVENFTTTDDVSRVALIFCIATTKEDWDKVLGTSKRIFPENRPVAIVMMYNTTSGYCKQTCEEAQKKHVEFLSTAEVFSIRYFINTQTHTLGFYNNEENRLVEFIQDHSILKTKVVGCPACAKEVITKA